MKTCSKCNTDKPFEEFNKRLQGYQNICRICQKQRYKEYYKSNPKEKERLGIKRKKERAFIRDFLWEIKDVPCADCGIKYPPYVMDFDHLDASLKEFDIAKNRFHYSIAKIKAEIAKCEVVCANCHRERTYRRLM